MGMILMPGGGGGIDLDVVTAVAGDVLSGKVIVGADGEPITGTLALTGNAGTEDVLSGKTFYNADAKTKRSGTLTLSGSAKTGDVLEGETFYSDDAKTKRSGTMVNRGALNWSGINTTKSVDAGYYSDGTLDSRPSYNAGYDSGRNQGRIDAGTYAFHHFLRLYSNPSPNTYLMNPSATSNGSTRWQNPGYSYNSDIFNYSNGVYTAKVACKLGIDAEFHTRYGRSRHYIQYSINNGSKVDLINKAGSSDDYSDYQGHGYVVVSLSANQNIRFFFGDAEANNTDTDFIIMARVR